MPPALPAAKIRADSFSFEDRDPAGQPVDVDVILAFARGERNATAIRAAIGEETDGADFFVQQVALRRVELEVDLLGQAMRARVWRHSKRARLEVELEQRFGALRYGPIPCQGQPGSEVTRGGLKVGTGNSAA